MRVDELRQLAIFEKVNDERLQRLLDVGHTVEIEPGLQLFTEGDPADHWWVLVDGAVDLFRTVGREEARVGQMLPGRWAGGFRAWDDDGVYLATGRGVEFGRLLKVPAHDLRDLMEEWLPLAVHLVRGVFGTARTIEATVRQRESLVTLGTLSAGLAHELNNPASAAVRTVGTMGTTLDGLLASLGQLAEGAITAEQFLALERLRRTIEPPAATRSPMQISDAEEELGEWLEDHDVEDAWALAATLAGAGVPIDWCEKAADLLPGRALQAGLSWVAGTLSVAAQLGELREATGRVSELVSAVRSYTQMDRASLQPVDVVEGLTSTLVMLGHKLKDGVEVQRDFAPDLPRIDAYAGELNQVWTNLIDNAVDAMDGVGTLRISTRAEDDAIVIEIADSGPGLSPEAESRAFDAFFTTKDVGKGTGLGLDIARRVVVERHQGTIELVREGGETVARIRLPR
ncbi:cyclic nucleotide-binding domain-containing protein [Nocardioides islandensis]|uniref:histidine kinase n=1 Tax=Nocardioides islandensis TaxID=433663 RepID=A0A930YG35_9ACTN|nr:ATP-binding protein [Nocardioides islandensis]MBF4765567.1 cyclic nucleotide-binding domain-containing protein [Nocardioides islandensis]